MRSAGYRGKLLANSLPLPKAYVVAVPELVTVSWEPFNVTLTICHSDYICYLSS